MGPPHLGGKGRQQAIQGIAHHGQLGPIGIEHHPQRLASPERPAPVNGGLPGEPAGIEPWEAWSGEVLILKIP